MIKLIRDSIFKPKNLISYRAKKPWYCILYVFIICLIGSVSYIIEPLKDSTITDADKYSIVQSYKSSGSKIENGVFTGNSITFEYNDYTISFINSSTELKTVSTSDLVVKGDTVYVLVGNSLSSNAYCKSVGTLKNLSSEFDSTFNLDGSDESTDKFINGLNDIYSKFKPYIVVMYGVSGFISSLINLLSFALLNYIYLIFFFRASSYMKKGQLFKMLVFACTSIVIADSIIALLNISGILYYLLVIISFIPELILEREIIKRIRMKIYGEKIINNEDVINKINEMLNKKKDDKDDNNDSED